VISWIVASHDPAILAANALPGLEAAAQLGDQVVIVRDGRSIAEAYTDGQAQAGHPVRCYLHHDVRIRSVPALRAALLDACTLDVGIVGVIGSTSRTLPWWEGATCGSVRDARLGLLNFGPGGHPAAYLDGLLLATTHQLAWDRGYTGWHLYDHDICHQQLVNGRDNWCLPAGRDLVEHHTTGPTSMTRLTGWDEGIDRFRLKWGAP
jgi:hypothetical protein